MSNIITCNHNSIEPTSLSIGKEKRDDSLIQEAAIPILNFLSLTDSSPFTHSRESSEFSVLKIEDEENDQTQAAAFSALNRSVDLEKLLESNIREARSIGIQMGKVVPRGVSMVALDRLERSCSQRQGNLYIAGAILLGIFVFALVLHNPLVAIVAGALLLTAMITLLLTENQLATAERQIDAYEKLFTSNDKILRELQGESMGQEEIDSKRVDLGLDQNWNANLDDLRMHTLYQKQEKEEWNRHIIDLVFEHIAAHETTIPIFEKELFSKVSAQAIIKDFTLDQKNDLILFLKRKGAFKKSKCSPVEIVSELIGIRPWFVWKCLDGTYSRGTQVAAQIMPYIVAHKNKQKSVLEDDRSLFPLIERLDEENFFEGDRRVHTYSILHTQLGLSGVQTFQMLSTIRNPGLLPVE